MGAELIRTRDLAKIYSLGDTEVRALDGVTTQIETGDFVAVMGPSGSGKSTFMNVLGCLDRPTRGEYLLDGQPVATLADDALAAVRNRYIGFVFQNFNLLARTSALENVALPLIYGGIGTRERNARATEMIAKVGLAARAHHQPAQLSGGQQQRVAIARAFISDPTIIVADEPTGDLDRKSAEEILGLLRRLNAEMGKTIVLVTHDGHAVESARHVMHLEKGELVDAPPAHA